MTIKPLNRIRCVVLAWVAEDLETWIEERIDNR